MNRLLTFAMVIAFTFVTMPVFAKKLNLYSEPKADSKVTGTANTDTGITIVYTPKTGEWIKVANPTNGDVGWIKSSDLGANNYNMRVINMGDGARSYSVFQFSGNTGQYSEQQIEKEMQQMEKQQRMMQIHLNHMFNNMFYFPPVITPQTPQH